MALYLISDLHLASDRAALCEAFSLFCRRLGEKDCLYILGDLFDYFIGFDEQDAAHLQVKAALSEAAARGARAFFIHGNRDFLLQEEDARTLGLTLLSDTITLPTDSGRALLLHGDQLCRQELPLKLLRALGRSRTARALFAALPAHWRHAVARFVRGKSQQLQPKRSALPHRYGLQKEQTAALMQSLHCNLLIHGHFHLKEQGNDEFFPGSARLALGCWGENYSYIRAESVPQASTVLKETVWHNFSLVELPLTTLTSS